MKIGLYALRAKIEVKSAIEKCLFFYCFNFAYWETCFYKYILKLLFFYRYTNISAFCGANTVLIT